MSLINFGEISQKVRSGEYKLQPKAGRAPVWKSGRFQTVLDNDNNQLFGIACCSTCFSCILYQKKNENGKITNLGTTNLNDHAARCRPTGDSSDVVTMDAFVRRPIDKLPISDRQKVRRSQMALVVSANLSFRSVEDDGFIHFAQV